MHLGPQVERARTAAGSPARISSMTSNWSRLRSSTGLSFTKIEPRFERVLRVGADGQERRLDLRELAHALGDRLEDRPRGLQARALGRAHHDLELRLVVAAAGSSCWRRATSGIVDRKTATMTSDDRPSGGAIAQSRSAEVGPLDRRRRSRARARPCSASTSFAPEPAGGQHGGEGEGHQQRHRDGEGHGDAEGVHEAAHDAAHEGHGQEDRDQREAWSRARRGRSPACPRPPPAWAACPSPP